MLFSNFELLYMLLILLIVPRIWSRAPDVLKTRQIVNEERNGESELKKPSLMKDTNRGHVAGLILARCGSKGIPRKNLAQVGNMTLLRRSISTMRKCGKFSSLWVSTDCNEIAQEAELSGAFVHRRAPETATDEAPSILAVKEFRDAYPEVTAVGLVQCTSPLLATPFLHDAFRRLQRDDLDSVFSVRRGHHLRWIASQDGEVKAANFDPRRRPRRQSWQGELIENGMFYFAKSWLIDQGLLQGGRMGVVEIPANYSYEIDSPVDLDFVRMRIKDANQRRDANDTGGRV